MGRKLRVPKARRQLALSPLERYALEIGGMPPHDRLHEYPGNRARVFGELSHVDIVGPSHRLECFRALWAQVRDELLTVWIAENPGTRPFAWWLLDAPRKVFEDGATGVGPEPRRHVGGSGTPFVIGVYPSHLATARGVLPFVDVVTANPPLIESEAAYLARHELLLPGERDLLAFNDFDPEVIDYSRDDNDDDGGELVSA
jgi:hypothetical protein